jgi:hypothetical protein
MKRSIFIALLGWLLVRPAWAAALDPATLIKLSTSVLKVEVIRVQGGYSLGSGVVVDADRVVTNCHVTRDARQIAVLQGGVRLPAQSQRVDAYHDLCLLRVRGIEGSRAVEFARGDRLAIGQPLTAVGHTAGALQSSVGEVLALHRLDGGRVIQSSNYFNSGASGGGLFDRDLRLVGILTFRLRNGRAHYFAMPAEWLADQLRSSQPEQSVGPRTADELAFWEKPLETQPLFLRAAVLENEGQWSALQPLAADWAHQDPTDPEPWYLLGIALDRQDQFAEARLALECSLSIAPDFKNARTALQRVTQRGGPAPEPSAAPAACRL